MWSAVVTLVLFVGVALAHPMRHHPGIPMGGTPIGELSPTEKEALAQNLENAFDTATIPCVDRAKVTLGQAALVTSWGMIIGETSWNLLSTFGGYVNPMSLEDVAEGMGEEISSVLTSPLLEEQMDTFRFRGLAKAVEIFGMMSEMPTDKILLKAGRRLATMAENNCNRLLTLDDSKQIVTDVKNSLTAGKVDMLKTELLSKLGTILPTATLDMLKPQLVGIIDSTVEQLMAIASIGEQLSAGSSPSLQPALATFIMTLGKMPTFPKDPFTDPEPTDQCYTQKLTATNLVALTVAYGIDQSLLRGILLEYLPEVPSVDKMFVSHKLAQIIETEAADIDTLAEDTLKGTILKDAFLTLRQDLPMDDAAFFISDRLPMAIMPIMQLINTDSRICTLDTAPIRSRLLYVIEQVKNKYTHSTFNDTLKGALLNVYTDTATVEQALHKIKDPLAWYRMEHNKTVSELAERLAKKESVTGILKEILSDLEELLMSDDDSNEDYGSYEFGTRAVDAPSTEQTSAEISMGPDSGEISITSTEAKTGMKKPRNGTRPHYAHPAHPAHPPHSHPAHPHPGQTPPVANMTDPVKALIKRLALASANPKPTNVKPATKGPHTGPSSSIETSTSTEDKTGMKKPNAELVKALIKRLALATANPKPTNAKPGNKGPHTGPSSSIETSTSTEDKTGMKKPSYRPRPHPRPGQQKPVTTTLEPTIVKRLGPSTGTCIPQKTLAFNIVMLSMLHGVEQMMMRFVLTNMLPPPTGTTVENALETLTAQLEPEAKAMVDFARLKELKGTKLDGVVAALHLGLPSKPFEFLFSPALKTALTAIRAELDTNPAVCNMDVQKITGRLITLLEKSKEKYVPSTFATSFVNGLSQFYTNNEITSVAPNLAEIFGDYREEQEELIDELITVLKEGGLVIDVLKPVMEDIADMVNDHINGMHDH